MVSESFCLLPVKFLWGKIMGVGRFQCVCVRKSVICFENVVVIWPIDQGKPVKATTRIHKK